MPKQPSNRSEAQDASQVEHLLGMLRDLSKRDPSPALRKRLSDLACQRLRERPESQPRLRGTVHRARAWLRPVFIATLLIAMGFTAALVARLRQRESSRLENAAKISPSAISSSNGVHTAHITKPSEAALPKIRHAHPALSRRASPQQMTMRLPYSNSEIDIGTDATIRISISQLDLLSLGFPVSATLQDRRVVAELTLGDDGLPRAISLPLPLEVLKEKK